MKIFFCADTPTFRPAPGTMIFCISTPALFPFLKNGSRHSYMVWEDGEFSWRDAETGEIYHRGHDGEIK